MGSNENRLRKKWQDFSGLNASTAEKSFFSTFTNLFEGTNLSIISKPKDLYNIYVNYPISDVDKKEIYVPDTEIVRHGVFPDYAIKNIETNKTIFIEIKRQDGWVEGKKRSAGRGNAHERVCKYFSPGLKKLLQTKGNLKEFQLPVWAVFLGDITRDPCRVREIACWFEGFESHYFFWRDPSNATPLIQHFIEKILPIIE